MYFSIESSFKRVVNKWDWECVFSLFFLLFISIIVYICKLSLLKHSCKCLMHDSEVRTYCELMNFKQTLKISIYKII